MGGPGCGCVWGGLVICMYCSMGLVSLRVNARELVVSRAIHIFLHKIVGGWGEGRIICTRGIQIDAHCSLSGCFYNK